MACGLGLLLVGASGCAARTEVVRDRSIVLREPALLRDMTVRQHLIVTAGAGPSVQTGEFDAVLQKRGDTLLVVGLGPAGVRAFVMKQTSAGVTFEQRFGPALPFPPERILLDIHRVFFRTIPPPANGEGVTEAVVDGEAVRERWLGGALRERMIGRADVPGSEIVSIQFGEGCVVDQCSPKTVVLRNETRGYSLEILNEEFR